MGLDNGPDILYPQSQACQSFLETQDVFHGFNPKSRHGFCRPACVNQDWLSTPQDGKERAWNPHPLSILPQIGQAARFYGQAGKHYRVNGQPHKFSPLEINEISKIFIPGFSLPYSKITPSKTGRPTARMMYKNTIHGIIFEQAAGYEDEINLTLLAASTNHRPDAIRSSRTLWAGRLMKSAFIPICQSAVCRNLIAGLSRIGFRVRKRKLNAFHLKASSW
jgi:hypothetical protein